MSRLCPVSRAARAGKVRLICRPALPVRVIHGALRHLYLGEGGLPSDRLFRQLSIMEALQQDTDILRRMSPEQKLTVMRTLIRQAWELKAAAIRARLPELSEPEVRARAWELVGGDRP
jgi:hypothetical protein